jgi:hypothetical protein
MTSIDGYVEVEKEVDGVEDAHRFVDPVEDLGHSIVMVVLITRWVRVLALSIQLKKFHL